MTEQPTKIGVMRGREGSFPAALIEEVGRRGGDVVAEYVKLGAPAAEHPVPYAVIVDRVSHEVPFYRSFLRHAGLRGVLVLNDPFDASGDERFIGASLAARLGIAAPRTVALPHKEYAPEISHDESLRNLVYPLDWEWVLDHVGLPCVLRDAHGGAGDGKLCHSLEELLRYYNQSGRRSMLVQESISLDRVVRCICLGRREVLPIGYDPGRRRYRVEQEDLAPALSDKVLESTRRLIGALGYDIGSVDWAIREGVPYVVDVSPAPELDAGSLGPHHFAWVVEHTVDLAVGLARNPHTPEPGTSWRGAVGERLTGQSDLDGSGDLAEELPSLAQGMPKSGV